MYVWASNRKPCVSNCHKHLPFFKWKCVLFKRTCVYFQCENDTLKQLQLIKMLTVMRWALMTVELELGWKLFSFVPRLSTKGKIGTKIPYVHPVRRQWQGVLAVQAAILAQYAYSCNAYTQLHVIKRNFYFGPERRCSLSSLFKTWC